ncbi:hypothetical protein LRS03_18700 [Rhizobacter sp. J219]|uniref:hypothetical protein n=1 Tax=Rhizobacter sp. J219 TaxID=2898430 RepID=UPI002150D988|nr:hypothetical protein [Rhizobacter sp. J219]MCR5884770.1 hypothetical protein [Rhizobacter sp. J219]
MTTWLILTATLPTSPSGLRVRVWRALKATGAGTLREGVYVLPDHADTAQALHESRSHHPTSRRRGAPAARAVARRRAGAGVSRPLRPA